jgi:hypothetical protein
MRLSEIKHPSSSRGPFLKEGTWALPETEKQIKQLMQLLAEPIPSASAPVMNKLYQLLGDDDLFDDMSAAGETADLRPIIIRHLPRLLDWSQWRYQPDDHIKFLIRMIRKKYDLGNAPAEAS